MDMVMDTHGTVEVIGATTLGMEADTGAVTTLLTIRDGVTQVIQVTTLLTTQAIDHLIMVIQHTEKEVMLVAD